MDKSTSKESSHPCDNPTEKKTKKIEFPWKILLLLVLVVLGYLTIYILFFAQIGLPPGEGLSNKDWLSFLGGYMSFAGSLIMSIMVYRQEKRLAQLTIKQSHFYLECAVDVCELAPNDFQPQHKISYIPNILQQSEDDDVTYFYRNSFIKKDAKPKEDSDDGHMLILSTTLYCSQATTVLNVSVTEISIFSINENKTIIEYKIKPLQDKYRISQTHNFLHLSHFLPNCPELKDGEYKLNFKVMFNTFDGPDDDEVVVYMEVKENNVCIVDGIENPCIPIRKLYI